MTPTSPEEEEKPKNYALDFDIDEGSIKERKLKKFEDLKRRKLEEMEKRKAKDKSAERQPNQLGISDQSKSPV